MSPFWSRWTFRRFNRIFASIFPAMQRRKMPLWLSQTCGFHGQFSTLLKCFAHIFKISSLSVRRVVSGAMWWLQNSFGHKWFSVHHEISSCPVSVRKRLNFLFSSSARNLACPYAWSGLSYKCCWASIIMMCLAQSVFFFKNPLNIIIIFIKPVLMFARWMT